MVDVTVRGAGIFGLSVAWACARRGARVRVIDPFGPGAGASGGIVGALAPHVPENWNDKKAFQFDSLIMAADFWAEVQAVGRRDPGYLRSGRLQPLADARAVELADQRAKTAPDLWQGRADWRVVPAADHGDWAPQSSTGFLIHDTLSARIHPRRACAALVAACLAKGVEITDAADDAGAVIWASGVQDLDAISAAAGRTLGNGVKGQAALLRFAAADSPQLFADALHIVPHGDGTVAIGSTSERDFTNATSTDEQLDDVIERARAAFPVLQGAEVVERWAGVRPRARSRAPLLGPHPLHAGAFIANGGFKIGFGIAPKVGAVMADLVLESRDAIPADFRPEQL
ncbi:FAD-binding oxidoreductase [Marinovum sp. 2_MG-2023]|uniref:NAD(P)/FAD-dependent oxidoreductase n=1 Tax=unclassified Marinovum TaxID=2647166 RepID=UPI0026E48B04|nr:MULTISPECIES: FAD-binding oxidoreductase [unclassified Marinovum]MDO6729689.1 FAD-binding oxidoreductase [Marinovum sp. 2_MG-2023]MDO6779503.1 FAD-binding oxidoreductase [Marinovum sp. 1_MG-2023]